MTNKLVEFEPLKEGKLIKRYKRFLADIKLNTGELITAHCPNTGPMKGILSDGAKVRVSYSSSPKRKLSWTWERIQVVNNTNDFVWVGINTLLANKIIKKVIENKLLFDVIGDIESINSEVTYGKDRKSRIDFLLKPKSSNPDNRNIYVEVKNTTWNRNNTALFPDTVTTRGQKHLRELMSVIPDSRGVLIPCITRNDLGSFSTGDEADPLYGRLFRQAVKHGLHVLPCCFGFNRDNITWEGFCPLSLD